MKPTRNDTALCLLRLCDFKLTSSQTNRLASLGLMQEGGVLSPEGFVCAYTALADIQYGGINSARTVIADAARQEASDWQAEIERRAAAKPRSL